MTLAWNESLAQDAESIIGYHFSDTFLLCEAFQAAGSLMTLDFRFLGQRWFPEGNKRLAIIGDTVLQLALAEAWYEGSETRGISLDSSFDTTVSAAHCSYTTAERFNCARQEVGCNKNLNIIGRQNGLDRLIILAGGARQPSVGTMAATVEAIIGAVYLDSGMTQAKGVIQTLGLLPTSGTPPTLFVDSVLH
ncbi:MAG: hypothetical protein LQ351_002255 [Letrouitia transgressa]|nr:MAG: hypothetical protein LQ351_002255 [Letrouitia transgressa]